MVDRRGPGIVVRGRWPPMPIVEWWDVWYRQIPGAAQVVDRMSRGVQRGLRELSNAGQGSPAPERQRSTPLESSPAVTTAPQASGWTETGSSEPLCCRGCSSLLVAVVLEDVEAWGPFHCSRMLHLLQVGGPTHSCRTPQSSLPQDLIAPEGEADKCKGRSTAREGPSLWRQEAEKESQNWQRCFFEKAENRPGQQ